MQPRLGHTDDLSSRAPRGDRPEAARPARALTAAWVQRPCGAGGAALNKYGNSNHTGGPWLTNTTSQGAVGR